MTKIAYKQLQKIPTSHLLDFAEYKREKCSVEADGVTINLTTVTSLYDNVKLVLEVNGISYNETIHFTREGSTLTWTFTASNDGFDLDNTMEIYCIFGEVQYDVTQTPAASGIGKEGTADNAEVFNDYENNVASKQYAHAEGQFTTASGTASHAEGQGATASGDASHAEGQNTKALGMSSHAEGNSTTVEASALFGHAEGQGTRVSAMFAHAEGSNTVASGRAAHAEGLDTQATGEQSHSEGYGTRATGYYSHAEGQGTKATSYAAHAEGINTEATSSYAHAEGNLSKASGESSHAEGAQTEAAGMYAHAEGKETKALGQASHTEGLGTKVESSAMFGHAEGTGTVVSGMCGHAEGQNTTASGTFSHAQGYYTTASGIMSHAQGNYTTAETFACTTMGLHNVPNVGNPGMYDATSNALVIGNGSELAKSNAFRVTFEGAVYGVGAYNTSGADYAEYFEWADGNVNEEDRIARFVTLDGNKIKLASSQDDYIVGIISGTASVIGNSYDDQWQGMYMKDEYGRNIYEEVEDEENGKALVLKLNPNYDSSKPYTKRSSRKEWDAVGMLGQLIVKDDGTCKVNSYCKPSKNGIATSSTNSSHYRVIERINDNLIKVILK